MSRGIDIIRNDMDSFNDSLIGKHSYCTQDMVNLLLNGKAISNLHDDDIDIGGQILQGLKERSEIGQLSLFEYYNNIKVCVTYRRSVNLPKIRFYQFMCCVPNHIILYYFV